MQPCSPPSSYVSFTSSTPNASLSNCNLFNNGNSSATIANHEPASGKQSNGSSSSSTNQADLAHISSSSASEKPAVDKVVVTTSNNLTPKPPKKRYLEEFKEPSKC